MLAPDKTKYLAAMEATSLGPLISEHRESAREKQFRERVLSSSSRAEDVRDPFCSSYRGRGTKLSENQKIIEFGPLKLSYRADSSTLKMKGINLAIIITLISRVLQLRLPSSSCVYSTYMYNTLYNYGL